VSVARAVTAVVVVVAVVIMAAGCATAPPAELVNARAAYARASAGPAARLAPADLRKARLALDQAERALSAEKDRSKAVDFAYVAERTAQIAEAHAHQTAVTEKATSRATQDLERAAGTLTAARAELAEAQRGEAQQAQQVGVERTAREAAEQKAGASEEKAAASEHRAEQADDALHRLSAKPADGRGMVITLPGSVLFRASGAQLRPAALRRLDEVASVVVAQGQDVVVEGHTDATGAPWSNVDLSRRRAESVRRYLVSRGCPTDRIVARGMGPNRPIADNTSDEGRASNRRVEIVIKQP
jgi:outer membrane protein OmpA-like peptidoglycan-associated protein